MPPKSLHFSVGYASLSSYDASRKTEDAISFIVGFFVAVEYVEKSFHWHLKDDFLPFMAAQFVYFDLMLSFLQ